MQCILVKVMNSRIRTPFYIFFLNPVYVAARSLRSYHEHFSWSRPQLEADLLFSEEQVGATTNYIVLIYKFLISRMCDTPSQKWKLIRQIHNYRSIVNIITLFDGKREPHYFYKDFAQICSPSQVSSFKKECFRSRSTKN